MAVTKSQVSVHHRFGSVFVSIRWSSRLGRQSVVKKLSPEAAAEFAEKVGECAERAAKTKPKSKGPRLAVV